MKWPCSLRFRQSDALWKMFILTLVFTMRIPALRMVQFLRNWKLTLPCTFVMCSGSEFNLNEKIVFWHAHLNRLVTKPTKWLCAQRRLRSVWVSTQSDQSSLSAWRKLGSLATHWAHSEDSDLTGRMPRLIWVFAGGTDHFVGFVTKRLI